MAETVQLSKAAMKNKKRAEKRSKARIQQIKENGIMSEEIEMKDPLAILRQQLQEAKDRKNYKRAAALRQQLWMVQDSAAGISLAEVELLGGDVLLTDSKNTTKNDTATTAPSSPSCAVGLTSVEKRLRALRKKLQQIECLKEKRAHGQTLEKTQIDKIMKEQETLDEIAEIELLVT